MNLKSILSYPSKLCIILIVVFSVFFRVEYRYHNPQVITWDVFGYYLYLPATFIHHDLRIADHSWLDTVEAKYHPTPTLYQLRDFGPNKVNIYYLGMSVAYLPGFIVGHIAAKLSKYPADGFSLPYQYALTYNGLFFALLGLFFLRKLLLLFFNEWETALTMLFTYLGTNVLFQTWMDATMPHNYVFAINCILLYLIVKWTRNPQWKYIIPAAALFGWAILIRPTEVVLLLFILLLYVTDKESYKRKVAFFKQNWKQVLTGLAIVMCIGSTQLFYWKYVGGKWFIFNLRAESLSILHPYTFRFLFSYKKGWLVYTPIMLFALIGFYSLRKNKPGYFWATLISFILYLYLVSSWDAWWYGDCFSQRAMVDISPLLAVPFGGYISGLLQKKKLVQIAGISILSLLLLLNIFQIWQFAKGIIDGERMTQAYYWKVFLKTHVPPGAKQLLEVDRSSLKYDSTKCLPMHFLYDTYDPGHTLAKPSLIEHFQGNNVLKLASPDVYSTTYKFTYGQLVGNHQCAWIICDADVYVDSANASCKFTMVTSIEHNGRTYKSLGIDSEGLHIVPGKWNHMESVFLTPYPFRKTDIVKAFIYLRSKGNILIDNYRISVAYPKNY